ncbi:MAG: diaminopimelate epimerase [Deltaproteobacteria bacterium]|nr:diaminopimelate epimerase [Deltaproteobacteria bacterium]
MQIPWFSNDKNALIQPGRPFVKMHGLCNDFVMVDGREQSFFPLKEEIIHICNRHEGVGADELLIVEPARSHNTYAFVRIINPDGREVEACGNATRCIGWLLLKECNKEEIQIETLGGILKCTLAGDKKVSVEMGRIRTGWQDIPLSRDIDTLHLNIEAGPLKDPVGMNIGNPHAVFFVDDVDSVDLPKYGKALQTHPLFPEEANIGVAQLLNPKSLKLSVWERPGNMTTSCGTGACVAVAAAHRRGLTTTRKMTVIMPAGSVEIELKDQDLAVMTGPVEICYAGVLV